MRTRGAITLLGVLALAAGALSATTSVLPVAAKDSVLLKVAKGQFRTPVIQTKDGPRKLPALSGSLVEAARSAYQAQAGQARASAQNGGGLAVTPTTLGCGQRNSDGSVRVNQDCTYRRQAEEIIKFNPADPKNLIAGQNDSRIGYNHCGFDYSLNSGQTWGDGLPPFWQHTNWPDAELPTATDPNSHTIGAGPGTLHTYDAASDPIVAADAQGRAFFGCIVFDLFTNANGLIVTQSPAGAGGSFYDNVPDHAVGVDTSGNLVVTGGRRFVVVEDNNGAFLHDKPFLTADFISNTANRNNVYATWSVFTFDLSCVSSSNPFGQCDSPIYGSMSTDHGLTWSTPHKISGSSPLCPVGQGAIASANECDQDQGSDPIVRPDGSLVVIFNNGNGTQAAPNQQLAVVCHPSGSSPAGSAMLNCGAPTRVGADVTAGEPLCDFGRGPEECIPGAFIRTNDYPRIAINRGNGNVYATWQDYRNGQYDIQLAQSTDGGLTWKPAAAAVNPDQTTDHYFPAIDVVASSGEGEDRSSRQNGESGGSGSDHVAISYYRTDRVPNENSTPNNVFAPCGAAQGGDGTNCQVGVGAENSDYDLSGGRALNTPYAAARVSPTFPPPDGGQAGFNGDYSGLTVVGDTAHPIWSDTRNTVPAQFQGQAPGQGVVHDEDIFTTARAVPSGRGD